MNIKRRQELFFDGIETSLSMAQSCYMRLRESVEQYSKDAQNGEVNNTLQNLIILDAWLFIDIINRLRILVSQSPGFKKNDVIKSFLEVIAQVESLRHFVQHLDNEIPKAENTGMPIWGSLSWVYSPPEMQSSKHASIMAIIPGRLGKSAGHPIVNPIGKKIFLPVDLISLSASSTTVNISEISRAVAQFEKQYNVAVAQSKEIQVKDNDRIIQIILL